MAARYEGTGVGLAIVDGRIQLQKQKLCGIFPGLRDPKKHILNSSVQVAEYLAKIEPAPSTSH
jgi:hypothetical protein